MKILIYVKKNDIIDYGTHGDMPKTFNEFLW